MKNELLQEVRHTLEKPRRTAILTSTVCRHCGPARNSPRASEPNRQEARTAMFGAAHPARTRPCARTTNSGLGGPPLHLSVSALRISAFFRLQSPPASSVFPPNNNSTDHDRGKDFHTVSLAAARDLQPPRYVITIAVGTSRHHPFAKKTATRRPTRPWHVSLDMHECPSGACPGLDEPIG